MNAQTTPTERDEVLESIIATMDENAADGDYEPMSLQCTHDRTPGGGTPIYCPDCGALTT